MPSVMRGSLDWSMETIMDSLWLEEGMVGLGSWGGRLWLQHLGRLSHFLMNLVIFSES